MTVTTLVGTDKGLFILRSNDRQSWTVDGPHFKGWRATASARDPRGRWFVATASQVYGTALHVSDDLEQWTPIDAAPTWGADSGRKLNQVWTFNLHDSRYYAGVDVAGLFASDDRGQTWQPVTGLNEHETRGGWFPGAGGLCAHCVLVDDANPQRVWCGISAVGVFRSDDGGATWTPKNEGVKVVIEDKHHPDIGYCVHGLAADPHDANTIWRRDHVGMYRSRDAGDHWERIENGLPSWFGFPIALDRNTKDLWIIPLESDEYRLPVDGRLEVYRSRDGGDSWQSTSAGLPREHAYCGVLRGALDVDHLSPCGVTFGTTAGDVYTSADAGESWTRVPVTLPRVFSVATSTD